ncbi:D-ribitol-5-phosphate phosphatase [Bacteroidia bacterium]|nr:D-ribitol-5-phosphate phosphatase [Bacteroidia bacterium]GHT28360.1 D-ribitol-5-phosphate phosphatase [Bacteroidia bacterium]
MHKSYIKGIKNIVFDLGGVIITLDRSEAVRRFVEAGLENAEELLDAYHQKGIFLELEEGKLSQKDFYEAVRKEAGKNISDEAIDYGWLGFLKEVPEYKLKMLEDLRKDYHVYLLSNTNPVIFGWALTPAFSQQGKSIDRFFDKMYTSYQIGYTKPASEIYNFMLKDSGMIPSETLFIDDGKANIEMGEKLGMKTYLAKNGEDFRWIFEK